MKLLAIESATSVASVAIITESCVVAEYTVDYKTTHSQTLLSMIDAVVKMTESNINEFDAIAVSGGPGSFTGLRIGSATAKGLGLAISKPLIHIPTVDALAYNLYGTSRVICPMLDARRTQVYSGFYTCESALDVIKEQNIDVIANVIAGINELGRPVVLLGDGVEANLQYIKENITVDYIIAPAHLNRCKAASVGALGLVYYGEGKIERASEHLPNYLRPSQAERELAEKQEAMVK